MTNSNQFIVPYMQYRRIPATATVNVRLTRDIVHHAVAVSIARYVCFIAMSSVVLAIRGYAYWKYTPSLALRCIVLISEIGRCVVVATQLGSVLTYSCNYKGVATWFSPIETGPEWDAPTQEQFRRLVWEHIGWVWPAKGLYWLAEKAFILLTGRTVFAKFKSPTTEDYLSDAEEIQLSVYDDDAPMTRNVTSIYKINFLGTPRVVVACMSSCLYATLEMRLLFGFPAFFVNIFNVVTPVLFAYFNTSDPTAKYFWLAEQLIVNVLKYYDWEDWSVNTTFGEFAVQPHEQELAAMGEDEELGSRDDDGEQDGSQRGTATGGAEEQTLHEVDITELEVVEEEAQAPHDVDITELHVAEEAKAVSRAVI